MKVQVRDALLFALSTFQISESKIAGPSHAVFSVGSSFEVKQPTFEATRTGNLRSTRRALKYLENYGADPTFTLTLCQGDCDTDDDCEGDLVCFQRNHNEPIPGCGGGLNDNSRSDYCVKPTATLAPTNSPDNSPTEVIDTLESTLTPTFDPTTESPSHESTQPPSAVLLTELPVSSTENPIEKYSPAPTSPVTLEPVPDTASPTETTAATPSSSPTKALATVSPTELTKSRFPSVSPTVTASTANPTDEVTHFPSVAPIPFATLPATESPAKESTPVPSKAPVLPIATDVPSDEITFDPSTALTVSVPLPGTDNPTNVSSFSPSSAPTVVSTADGKEKTTDESTLTPSVAPVVSTSVTASNSPSEFVVPSNEPTVNTSQGPSVAPASSPEVATNDSQTDGMSPSASPTRTEEANDFDYAASFSVTASYQDSVAPTDSPTFSPTTKPTSSHASPPTNSPTTSPTASPTISMNSLPETSGPTAHVLNFDDTSDGPLVYIGDKPNTSEAHSKLGICTGDCDSDYDCAEGLMCWQRNQSENVPGCVNGGAADLRYRDYCVDEKYRGTDGERLYFPGDNLFRLKLYWEHGYFWQEETFERRWCIECIGKTCAAGDRIQVSECSQARNDLFEFVDVGNGYFQIKEAAGDVCYGRFGNSIKWQACDADELDQHWIATDLTGTVVDTKTALKFELRPRRHLGGGEKCVTQRHHPKDNEALALEACHTTRKHSDTSLWNKY